MLNGVGVGDALSQLDRRDVPPGRGAPDDGLVGGDAIGEFIPRDGQRELGHVAVGEGVGLCLVGPEVQVCLLLLVGAEGDVVDVRLPGLRAAAEGNVGEPVALVVGEPRRQPDRPGAGGLHQ